MGLVSKDRLRAKLKNGDTTVRILLSHPMHTGRAKDNADKLISAEYIQDIRCWRNDIEILAIKCGTATAKNPYFSFQVVAGEAGDKISLRWVDNLGRKGFVDTTVI
ncbi:thiosulfate oxidation carrier complex protein SoxZ [Pseudomonadota bacterium]|nr:thiosulfate oxidation carrier complex protein SoxZ [Pseudomonadota bacterium]